MSRTVSPMALLDRAREKKLFLIDDSETLEDLRISPGSRLEALKGDRQGDYRIRINRQYRVCFRWSAQGAQDVEITQTEPLERMEIPFQRVKSLVNGRRAVTPDTALRLSRVFGTRYSIQTPKEDTSVGPSSPCRARNRALPSFLVRRTAVAPGAQEPENPSDSRDSRILVRSSSGVFSPSATRSRASRKERSKASLG
jgi:plasmid maintenance system killer protein